MKLSQFSKIGKDSFFIAGGVVYQKRVFHGDETVAVGEPLACYAHRVHNYKPDEIVVIVGKGEIRKVLNELLTKSDTLLNCTHAH